MQKPKLGFWDIWNMSFGFLGIQFGFALQNANVSRIFSTLNAPVEDLAVFWLAAPLTGLIVQPIIGYFSDRTWTRLGRRRPYFLVGAILSSLALVAMPNSSSLWMAIGVLWIMDSSINISMEPFRAFVGDNLPQRQRALGFSMQSFFIGIGAVVGSLLPYMFTNWMGISNTAPEGVIPDSVTYSFYAGAAVFLIAVLWTVFNSKEYSPEEMAQFEQSDIAKKVSRDTPEDLRANINWQFINGVIMLLIGIAGASWVYFNELKNDLYILTVGLVVAGLLFIVVGLLRKQNIKNGFTTIITDMQNMPITMKQLSIVQFFSWFALFSMWIYMNDTVTGHVFNFFDKTSQGYNDAADWVPVMFGVYNGVAAAVAFLLPVVAKRTSNKVTHMLALILGGLGLISVYFVSDRIGLVMSMVGVGVAWASILSIPYAMLSGSLPSNKMGYYMGVFNFFIVIPQLVAASILGYLVGTVFNEQPVYAILIGGCSMILAGLLTLNVTTARTVNIPETPLRPQ
ncbi:MFS transporter [Nonlabens agnitus]|uniref:MFS transporter n=1 Tax=Nonlabens agnitus TaxID=870484 RepID=A0A2S9WV75_9FLAO|nr:MFS transporter [Nonlabens agnitus]PRP67387.1 MFS transporter [Nonlabens agnitus]